MLHYKFQGHSFGLIPIPKNYYLVRYIKCIGTLHLKYVLVPEIIITKNETICNVHNNRKLNKEIFFFLSPIIIE